MRPLTATSARPGPTGKPALAKSVLLTVIGLGTMALLAGCTGAAPATPAAAATVPRTGSPSPVPSSSQLGPTAHSDSRITLPTTMTLSFERPIGATRTEHEVLYTVQEALRAELEADYEDDAAGQVLAQFWSGPGLASARAAVASWTTRGEQPVGVLRITRTSYRAPDSTGAASVTYCAGWNDVLRGDARTHTLNSAVQRAGTAGVFTTMTLHRAAPDHRWLVTRRTETIRSPRCRTEAKPTTDPRPTKVTRVGVGPSRATS